MKNARILVVDDSVDIRFIVCRILERSGYVVTAVANGEEALDQLRTLTPLPNLILLDLMMPVMDGWTFRARIESIPELKDIPIVVVTAMGCSSPAIKADAFLEKPIDMSSLLLEVGHLTSRSAALPPHSP